MLIYLGNLIYTQISVFRDLKRARSKLNWFLNSLKGRHRAVDTPSYSQKRSEMQSKISIWLHPHETCPETVLVTYIPISHLSTKKNSGRVVIVAALELYPQWNFLKKIVARLQIQRLRYLPTTYIARAYVVVHIGALPVPCSKPEKIC